MKTTLVALFVAALAIAVPGAAGEQSAGQGRFKPPPVYVGSKGEYVRAAQGSFCYSDEDSDLCADYLYPLEIAARLPVAGGQRLTVDLGMRAKRLTAHLLRVEGDEIIFGKRVGAQRTGKGRFWKLRLPADLEDADVVDLFLVGPRGDSNVWAGLEVAGGA